MILFYTDRKMRHERKGISPLIASVLLIAFTLAIGAFFSTWLNGVAKQQTEGATENSKPECTYVNLNVQNATYTNSTKMLALNVENTGTKSVILNKVKLFYNDNAETYGNFTAKTIDGGDSTIVSFDNTTTNGSVRSDIKKLRIITDCPSSNIEYGGASVNQA